MTNYEKPNLSLFIELRNLKICDSTGPGRIIVLSWTHIGTERTFLCWRSGRVVKALCLGNTLLLNTLNSVVGNLASSNLVFVIFFSSLTSST